MDLLDLCPRCRVIPNVAALKIKREKISKQDVAFMKKVEHLGGGVDPAVLPTPRRVKVLCFVQPAGVRGHGVLVVSLVESRSPWPSRSICLFSFSHWCVSCC